MPRRSHAVAVGRASAASFKAGTDAATTIALRLPILMASPSAATAAEWQRAWTEKMIAAFSGAVEAGAAMQKLALKMGPAAVAAGAAMQTRALIMAPGAVAAAHLGVALRAAAAAATRPGYKAVAANARRLARKPRAG